MSIDIPGAFHSDHCRRQGHNGSFILAVECSALGLWASPLGLWARPQALGPNSQYVLHRYVRSEP